MGNDVSHPTVDKVGSEEYVTSTGLSIGVSGLQGYREEMEDRYILMDFPSRPNHTLCAIFDGHGGSSIANFAKKHFLRVCEETVEWKTYLALGDDVLQDHVDILQHMLTQTFCSLDEEMKNDVQSGYMHSGSTACVVVITPHHMVCANAGDSRCVVGRMTNMTRTAVDLSPDCHTAEQPLEKARVEAAGGCVNFGCIDGKLRVSRGFGDGLYKQNATVSCTAQKVSPLPDVTIHVREDEADDVLVLGSVGLWTVIDSYQVVEKIRDLYRAGEQSSLLLAEELIHGALFEGKSKDNISAVVCILPAAEFGQEEQGGVVEIRAERKFFRQDEYSFDISRDMYDNLIGKESPTPQPGSLFYNDQGDY